MLENILLFLILIIVAIGLVLYYRDHFKPNPIQGASQDSDESVVNIIN